MRINRQTLFRHYWWLAIVVGSAAFILALCLGGSERMVFAGSAIAGTLGFCYFAQQQKLAETVLFKDLFTCFNRRYDRLNDRLADIAPDVSSLADAQRKLIIDYFNLCSEEYLFYKEGYILDEAWGSWCRGMLGYLKKESFQSVWKSENPTDSYYGLSLAVIQKGAALERSR